MFKIVLVCAIFALVAASDESTAETHKLSSDVRHDGFEYIYETSNGIAAQASGDEHGNHHGNYGYKSPEGEQIELHYTADESGYHPSGSHLPTPPPVPEAIQKLVAYLAAHGEQEH